MKKHSYRLICIIFLFLFLYPKVEAADLYFKGMGGWGYSGTQGHFKSFHSLSAGAGVEFWIFRSFGIEIDLLYVQKGHKATPGYYPNSDGSFPTLSFPVLLRARVPLKKDSPLSLGVMGGIAPTLILQEMDPNSAFANHDFTIMVGAVLEIKLKNVILLLDARYDWGLNLLSIDYIPGRVAFNTSTLYVMAGFKLGL